MTSPISDLRTPITDPGSSIFDDLGSTKPTGGRRSEIGDVRLIVVALVLAGLTTGCATTQQPSDDPSADEAAQTETASTDFGADPMGTARRWAASPPADTPEAVRDRVETWADPVVLRLYRAADDQYRAVVAGDDARDAEAVLLTITPAGDSNADWRVDSVKPTDASHAWPTN